MRCRPHTTVKPSAGLHTQQMWEQTVTCWDICQNDEYVNVGCWINLMCFHAFPLCTFQYSDMNIWTYLLFVQVQILAVVLCWIGCTWYRMKVNEMYNPICSILLFSVGLGLIIIYIDLFNMFIPPFIPYTQGKHTLILTIAKVSLLVLMKFNFIKTRYLFVH